VSGGCFRVVDVIIVQLYMEMKKKEGIQREAMRRTAKRSGGEGRYAVPSASFFFLSLSAFSLLRPLSCSLPRPQTPTSTFTMCRRYRLGQRRRYRVVHHVWIRLPVVYPVRCPCIVPLFASPVRNCLFACTFQSAQPPTVPRRVHLHTSTSLHLYLPTAMCIASI